MDTSKPILIAALQSALFLTQLFPCSAAEMPTSAGSASSDVAAHTDALLDAPALRGGIVGVDLVRVSDGVNIYNRDARVRLMPASNRKLFTAASALHYLGPNFRFETDVVSWDAPGADGTLDGGICLRGAGDSALSQGDLDRLADQLYHQGLRTVHGNVYGDGTLFAPGELYGTGWGWDYLSDDYAAAISGLEVDDGDFAVNMLPGASAGAPVLVNLSPPIASIAVVNLATTVPTGATSTARIERAWDRDSVTVTGVIPANALAKKVIFAVSNPVSFAANCFMLALERHGIVVTGMALPLDTPITHATVLASMQSQPLDSYLALMLKPSDNLIAESLIRIVGLNQAGTRKASAGEEAASGGFDAGAAAEADYLKTLGIGPDEFDFSDGSGVSRRDVVTAHAVCILLESLARDPEFPKLYDDLPIAGVDGTLRKRMIEGVPAGAVHAKTGTLTGACALSGYFTAKSGNRYAFSILCNNYPGSATEVRSIQDTLVEYWFTRL